MATVYAVFSAVPQASAKATEAMDRFEAELGKPVESVKDDSVLSFVKTVVN
jgi:hypothetical protein